MNEMDFSFVSEVFLNSLCRSWGSIIYMERSRFLQGHPWQTWGGIIFMEWSSIAIIGGPWLAQFPGDLFGFVRLTENAGETVKRSNCTVSGSNGRPDTTQSQK